MIPFVSQQKFALSSLFRLSIAIFSVFLMTSLISATEASAAQATLSWNAPTTYTDGTPLTNLSGYRIYTGSASGSYSQNIDVGNTTSYTLSSLNDATTYYFAVTAYDASGDVSGFSSQVSYTTPAATTSSLYTLTSSAGSGGSITPTGTVIISGGTSQKFTITPASGYKIAGVAVDGASVGAVSSYTFSNVAANHTISATFAASTSTSNSITSSSVWQNQSFTSQNGLFTATFDTIPNAANIDAVTVLSAAPALAYTDAATIVRFNSSGTIDVRNGSAYAADLVVPYSAGSTYHVRMAVNVTSHVYDVYVTPPGGTEIHLAAGYAFRTEQATVSALANIGVLASIGSHQVLNVAVAPQVSYSISASASTGGSISPAGIKTVNVGGSQSYTISPATGYKIAGVTVDGASVGAVSSYAFSNVNTNHTISATFTASYSISATAGTGGNMSPAGTTTVTSGGSQSYSISPAAGYKIAGVTVDGVSVGAVSSYTFSNVTASHTIAATFAVNTYAITASAGTGGSISPAGTTTLNAGASKSYSISPAAGYKIAGVTVDGVSVGAVTSYVFANVQAKHAILASFVKKNR